MACRWFDAGDKRFAPDNIIIDSRNANFIAIIDQASGKVVWRLGPNFAGHGGDALEGKHPTTGEVDQISGQHDAQLIPEGLPGAGNLLVFDNQGEAGYPPAVLKVTGGSRVLEIDPTTQKIVWSYSASLSGSPDWTFYSSFISDARRLPNGNTFIDEGMNGRLFQVTPRGEIVWEYVSPFVAAGPIGGGDVTSNWVYRAQPVPYGWVPDATPRAERPVTPPALASFRVGGSNGAH